MDDNINFIDYWKIIVKRKKAIAIIVFVVPFLSMFYALSLPDIYKAEATIMPISGGQTGGLAALGAMRMGLGSLLGSMGGGSSSSHQLLNILNSHTLAEEMIEKKSLMKVLFPMSDAKDEKKISIEDAASLFLEQISAKEDIDRQLIVVKAEMKDPVLAAQIVNGYLDELRNYINKNTLTASKRNRIFIEKQFERNKAEFLKSGRELTTFFSADRVSNSIPTIDVDISLEEASDEREGIITPAASIASDAREKTDRLQKKLEEIRTQIENEKIVRNVPQQIYLQYLVLERELLGQVNVLLSQQYETAKIEESKEDLIFQVIDRARVPAQKFKPSRKKIVQMAFILSLVLSVFYAFLMNYLDGIKKIKNRMR